jgi:chromatin assembly factor 1 subunit A
VALSFYVHAPNIFSALDTPFPIDPFTFVSAEIQDRRSNAVFVVPALPDRLTAPALNTVTSPHDLSTPSSVILHVPAPIATSANHSLRRTVLTPKTTFPDVYLPQLLSKITSLQTGNLTFLVESVYQELRGFGVKKNAVEAKLKEVGEKSKEKRVWIVKNNATVSRYNTSPCFSGLI